MRTDLSRLDENARESGVGIDIARKSFKTFNSIVDEVDSSVEGVSNLLQAGFTESNLQKAVEGLTGAYLKFPDTLKIESLADSLQETLATGESTGQFAELLDRLGKSTDDFNTKLQSLTSETDKQNYALQVLADAGLNDTYNQYLKNNEALIKSKETNQEYEESVANLSERLVPISIKITETMTKIIDKTAGVLDYLLDIAEQIQSGDLSIEEALQKVVGDGAGIVGNFIQGIVKKIPRLMQVAGDFISNLSVGIEENLPSFISKGLDIITGLSSNLRENIGMIVDNGIELITALGNGIIESLPTLIEKVPQIVIDIAGVINDNAPKLLFAGIELIGKLIVGLITSIPTLIANLPKIIEAIVATIMAFNWLNLGSKIMNGISNGVKKMGTELRNAFTNGFKGALEYIKALPGRAVTWGKDFIQLSLIHI